MRDRTPSAMLRQGLAALAMAAAVLASAGCAQTPRAPAPVAEPAREAQRTADQEDERRRAHTRLELAAAYYGNGQMDTALVEVERALQADPDLPQGLNLRGLIHASLGDDARAEASFRRALQVAPADGDIRHNYGWFLCQRNRHPEAQAMFAAALAQPQYRSHARTLLVQGVCEARAGRLEQAEKTLLRAYELDAGNPATAMNLGEVLYRRGEYERARFYVRRVNGDAELRNAESLWLAARIERKLGNEQGARDFGNQLRGSYPRSREAVAFEQGRYDD